MTASSWPACTWSPLSASRRSRYPGTLAYSVASCIGRRSPGRLMTRSTSRVFGLTVCTATGGEAAWTVAAPPVPFCRHPAARDRARLAATIAYVRLHFMFHLRRRSSCLRRGFVVWIYGRFVMRAFRVIRTERRRAHRRAILEHHKD